MENGKWKMSAGVIAAEAKPGDIPTRAFLFALRIIKLCRYLDSRPGTCRTLASQILRAGTNLGSNVEEGQAAQSRADFIAKYSISLKEARETLYRLRLLSQSGLVATKRVAALIQEAEELTKMLGRAIVTARRRSA